MSLLRHMSRLVFALAATALAPVVNSSQCQQSDARWAAVARGLGREGKVQDGYYRVEFPRRDLKVYIGEQKLEMAFELTSYVAFVPTSNGNVLSMGELVLRDDEVNAVMEEARRQNVDIAALHNHLIGEAPRLLFTHLMIAGEPGTVAQKLHALLARTGTPLGKEPEEAKGNKADWSGVSASLGDPDQVESKTAEWEVPRRDAITEGGVSVKSTGALETASEVVFQRLSNGRAATTGEMFISADEITPVTHALEAGGIHVTAIHMHMVRQSPQLYWLHWYAVGDPAVLGKTIRAAFERTNSALPRRR